MIALMNQC